MICTKLSLCFSLFLCLPAALASAAPFVSPYGCRLTLPPGWRVAAGSSPETIVFECLPQSAGEGPARFRTDFAAVPRGTTLEAKKRVIIEDHHKASVQFVVISQSYSRLGGVRDFDLVGTLINDGSDGSEYLFSAGCLQKDHAKYDPVFAQMLASVRWK